MITWYELAEDVLILKLKASTGQVEFLRSANVPNVLDFVSSDIELAVHHDSENISDLVDCISKLLENTIIEIAKEVHEIPVCYELGLDWEEIVEKTGLARTEIERIHVETIYEASYGFAPGFLYLGGLYNSIHCARKAKPRTKVPKGSIGIGGSKTGIYSLESPGGWQIIGQTPMSLFDPESEEPFVVPNGSRIKFKAISLTEYRSYGSH